MDRVKVIKGLEYCEEYFNCCDKCPYWDGGTHCAADLAHDALELLKEQQQQIGELQDLAEYLTDKQKEQKFLVDSDGKITPLPVVVRCKDCIHRGKSEKCVLAAISEEKDCQLFMLDNRGEWFCADGERRE